MTYRKKYISHHKKIPNGWTIHHIDFNSKNNLIENLIAVPKMVHDAIHRYFLWWGNYVDVSFLKKRDAVVSLIDIFEENKNKQVIMNLEIAFAIKKFVNGSEKKKHPLLFKCLDWYYKQFHPEFYKTAA